MKWMRKTAWQNSFGKSHENSSHAYRQPQSSAHAPLHLIAKTRPRPVASTTVYANSIGDIAMGQNYDADEVELIEIENEALREEVIRHRQNVERLVDMLTVVTDERDRLRREVATKAQTSLVMRIGEMSSLSQNNQQLYQQNRHLQDMVVKLATPRDQQSPF
jgi:hypothetical protein